jgi:photosystem II stability/assembly factor-like uncharacterized protein
MMTDLHRFRFSRLIKFLGLCIYLLDLLLIKQFGMPVTHAQIPKIYGGIEDQLIAKKKGLGKGKQTFQKEYEKEHIKKFTPLPDMFEVEVPPLQAIEITKGLDLQEDLTSFAQSPSNLNHLVLGTESGKVYLSTDAGKTWLTSQVSVYKSSFMGAYFAGSRNQHRLLEFNVTELITGDIEPTPGRILNFDFNAAVSLEQRLPQAKGIIRDYFDDNVESMLANGAFLEDQDWGLTSQGMSEVLDKARGWGFGMAYTSLLEEKVIQSDAVNFLSFNPINEKHILAGLTEGIYESTDGGITWRWIAGIWEEEPSAVLNIRFHPSEFEKIWVGVEEALYVSNDSGKIYEWISNPDIEYRLNVRDIAFQPFHPEVMYFATQAGLLRSEDGGETTKRIYFNVQPHLNDVRCIYVDPFKQDLIMIGTMGGAFMSRNAGKTFERIEYNGFYNSPVYSISSGFVPNHYLLATEDDLWESFDGGSSWHPLYLRGSNENLIQIYQMWDLFPSFTQKNMNLRREPILWLLSETSLFKLVPFENQEKLSGQILEQIKSRIKSEPSIEEVLQIALNEHNLGEEYLSRYRSKARISALLPDFWATFHIRNTPLLFDTYKYMLDPTNRVGANNGLFQYETFVFFAKWDLLKLFYHPNEKSNDRKQEIYREISIDLQRDIIQAYQERRHLLISLHLDPQSQETQLYRLLRYEELNALLSHWTNGLYPSFQALNLRNP